MSDRAEGAVADTGEAIQRQINRVDDAATQTTDFIRKHPIAAGTDCGRRWLRRRQSGLRCAVRPHAAWLCHDLVPVAQVRQMRLPGQPAPAGSVCARAGGHPGFTSGIAFSRDIPEPLALGRRRSAPWFEPVRLSSWSAAAGRGWGFIMDFKIYTVDGTGQIVARRDAPGSDKATAILTAQAMTAPPGGHLEVWGLGMLVETVTPLPDFNRGAERSAEDEPGS